MKYRLVIFDMDGTIADTSPGILNSHRYAHRMMGRTVPEETVLRSVIGGPLLQTYETRFGFDAEAARRAVEHYRQYYQEHGIHEAEVYTGMPETLQFLKQAGIKLAVASLKAERFLPGMLAEMGIGKYFDAIYGMDDLDSRSKSDLLNLCMQTFKISEKETLLVGDSIHDQIGAMQSGIDFLGVTYGFGFQQATVEEPDVFCNTTHDILSLIRTF